jgi:DNA-3-methyladenine glycosylase
VARDLLGKVLWHGDVGLQITEVEAYGFPDDSANHCFRGQTERNLPMWGPPGRAYVYLCYGVHCLLNLVTEEEGRGAAVLIRSSEPVAGLEVIRARRKGPNGPALLTGPGKVAQALGIDRSLNSHPLYEPGGLELREGTAPDEMLCGPRVGIHSARPEDIARCWRFASAGTAWVSHRGSMVAGPVSS